MIRLSVIVSTYERPEYLAKSLRGFARQTDSAFEVVIADDGSSALTGDVIEDARLSLGLRVIHVWHEHRGFRKSLIMNRAIAASTGNYILCTDGDCIPRDDLIATHKRLARPRRYVAGGYLKLSPAVTEAIELEHVDTGQASDLAWLRLQGWKPGRRRLRLNRNAAVGALLDFLTPTAADFHGNNASTWKEALYRVNGFESTMGYGGLDKALGHRLQNAGIKGIQARHRAITMHLHHDRPYRDADVMRRNRELINSIRRERIVEARSGLAQLEPDPGLRISGATA